MITTRSTDTRSSTRGTSQSNDEGDQLNYDGITHLIGPLFRGDTDPEWPMYSFTRPSHVLWNAIAISLHKKGWSEEEIKDWMQSKEPRWALDGDLGTELKELGIKYAAKCHKVK